MIYFLIKTKKKTVYFLFLLVSFVPINGPIRTLVEDGTSAQKDTLRTLNDDKVPLRRVFFFQMSRLCRAENRFIIFNCEATINNYALISSTF